MISRCQRGVSCGEELPLHGLLHSSSELRQRGLAHACSECIQGVQTHHGVVMLHAWTGLGAVKRH